MIASRKARAVRSRTSGVDWSSDETALFAKAEIRQSALFGEQLSLIRRIEADAGGQEIRLIDTVTNLGFDTTSHAILYHVNLGYPLLDGGAKLWADIEASPFACATAVTRCITKYPRPPSNNV